MFRRLFNWLARRWPLSPLIRLALEEDMAGGPSFAYVFGSAALIILILQVITGIWQLFYYVPTLAQGYNSLNYLRTEVPFGWLVHGLHYWGANVMVVCVFLHMSQVFIWGAYKEPHELQWVTGILLFLLTMGMSLTGGALPWDKRSYWLIEVASSAAGSMPLLGDWIKRLMLAGGVIGQLTLSRFFILHVALISGALMGLAAFHLVALRKVGNAGPWDKEKHAVTGPFWPDQVFNDGLVVSAVLFALIALSVVFPPPYAGMADPLDATYIPKPEWNFLFFYQALKYFPGKLEIIATAGIPLVGTLLLLLIPFFDRDPERRPTRRPLAMGAWAIAVAGFIGLTAAGAISQPEGLGEATKTVDPPPIQTAAAPAAASPAPPAPSSAKPSPAVNAGQNLFQAHGCTACHKIDGNGGAIGPDLSGEGIKGRTREWLTEQLRNPKAHNPASIMPPQTTLSPAEIGQLVDYLLARKTPASAGPAPGAVPSLSASNGHSDTPGAALSIIGSAEHGAILFAKNCVSCHGPEGKSGIANPGSQDGKVPTLNPAEPDVFNADPRIFAANADRYLQHGMRPEGLNPLVSMIPFGDTNALTQQQIADLEAYILNLNGVDRGQINQPGVRPDIYLIGAGFVYAITGLNLFGWWWFGGLRKKRRKEEKT